jgi:hypothetical protein
VASRAGAGKFTFLNFSLAIKSTPIPEVPIYPSAFVVRTNATLASGRAQSDRNYTRSVRVAVGFFGLIRNIGPVLPSILANLLSPISKNGRGLDAFVHTILLDKITCSRNGESNVALNKSDYLMIPACRYAAEDQNAVDGIIKPVVQKAVANSNKRNSRSVLLDFFSKPVLYLCKALS